MTRRWTGKELELLKTLYQEGRSIAYLSDVLRRTPASIRMQSSRLGLRRGIGKKENGTDLLAEMVSVLKGHSEPQSPLMSDLFEGLREEYEERVAMAPRCPEHGVPKLS